MKPEFSEQILERTNIRFYQNPSSGSRVGSCGERDGQTDRQKDGRTDMTKVIVAFRNFAKASKEAKFALELAMKAVTGSKGTAVLFL
jgi:hypothetical protein